MDLTGSKPQSKGKNDKVNRNESENISPERLANNSAHLVGSRSICRVLVSSIPMADQHLTPGFQTLNNAVTCKTSLQRDDRTEIGFGRRFGDPVKRLQK